MRRTITIAILVILIMGIIPFTIAEKPTPLGASVTPSFDIGESEEGEGSDDDSGDTTDTVVGSGGGGGIIATTETREHDTEPSEEDDTKEKSFNGMAILSQQVVAVTPVFRVWRVNKFISQDPNATEMLMSFSDNSTLVFLHLSRAEQKRFLNMSQEQAEETLMNYQLVAVNKSLLYKVRVIPSPILVKAQERVVETKHEYEDIKDELDDEKEKFENARLGRDEEQATEHAKNFMLKTADLVIKALERIKYNVEATDDLDEEEAQEIIEEIDSHIQDMEQAKADVEAAETKEEVQEAGRVILQAWKRIRIEINRYAVKLIHAKFGDIIQRSEHLEDKLDCTLQNMENQGINVTNIDEMVNEFSMNVSEARQKFKDARTYLEQAKEIKSDNATDEELEEAERLVEESKNLIDEAKRQLNAAHELLKQIVREIKAAGGEIVDCKEPELEEDEVYDVVEGKCEPCLLTCVLVDEEDEDGCQVCKCGGGQGTNVSEFCGTSTFGFCETDEDCMTGGCSGQVCQSKSEEPVVTTCEWTDCYDSEEYGVVCACVDSKCTWVSG